MRDLDSLRGVLALYVLLGHSRWLLWAGHAAWLGQPHAAWAVPLVYGSASLRFGREAVMVFFVLSGFFIHLRAARALRQGGAAALAASDFYRRRAHRLVAPYAFALVVTAACDIAGRAWFPMLYAASTGDALLDGNFAKMGYTSASVVPALVLLPSSLGLDFGSNGPLWSLAFETVYYALYPAWLALRRRHAGLAFGVVPAVCLALALIPGSLAFPVAVLMRYPIWLAGAFLAEHFDQVPPSARAVSASAATFAAGMAILLLTTSPLLNVVAALLFGSAAVVCMVSLPNAWRPQTLLSVFELLGIRGYSIYIVHFPFLALMSAWVHQTRGARPFSGWLAAGGAALAVAFGCACFDLCERHFLHARLRVSAVRA